MKSMNSARLGQAKPRPNPTLEQHTVPFLAALAGLQNPATAEVWNMPFTFQTVDDARSSGEPRLDLTSLDHSSLASCVEKLEQLNRAGAGVFVTVNMTDGKGRKKANIICIRGWWVDLDLKDATEIPDLDFLLHSLPLRPTIIVETPGGWHLYWLAIEPIPCDDASRMEEHEAELRGIQQALKALGADAKVCDVSRVMRLPGFLHQKADQLIVELVKTDGPRWTREEVRAAFPPQPRQAKKEAPSRPPTNQPQDSDEDRSRVINRASTYLATIPGGIQGSNGSRSTLEAALKTITRFDLSVDEVLNLMETVHNPKCIPTWSNDELLHKVEDAWNIAQASPDLGCSLRDGTSAGSAVPKPCAEEEVVSLGAGTDAQGHPNVSGFEWNKRGLFQLKPSEKKDDDGNLLPPDRQWIAPPFTLPGLLRNEGSNDWQLLIAWNDLDGVAHEEALPFEIMSGEGAELARKLGHGGLVLSPEPALRKALLRYLCAALSKVPTRIRLVDSLGWQGGAFVLPNGETIGQTDKPVRYAGESVGLRCRATSGTLEAWQNEVARYAVGNPRLTFGLSCAFAGPIMGMLLPGGGGGFNLQGYSSKGKSTILECAASVWGSPNPLPQWRATANGLEGLAAARNDGFLVLDELGQVDPKEAGQVAYMLANGSAKTRMNREGGNRPLKQWQLIFLSSGEQGLEDKLSEDGKRAKAGQEVRVPDIPCPASGMLDHAHGFPNMGTFADHLKAHARKHYGHASLAFLSQLCVESSRRNELQGKLKTMAGDWLASAIPASADPQVRRVGGRFALVAVAGELAQSMGILPWPEGEAERAALVCFRAWLDGRGFSGASEVHKGIEAVLAFIEKHGLSRFDEWGKPDQKVSNRAGTRKHAEAFDGWDFYLTPEAWREACQGFMAKDVARACVDAGLLAQARDGKSTSAVITIPHHGKARCYLISAAAIARYQEGEAA